MAIVAATADTARTGMRFMNGPHAVAVQCRELRPVSQSAPGGGTGWYNVERISRQFAGRSGEAAAVAGMTRA